MLHFPIPCLPMTKGHFSFSPPILALKSHINNSLSVRMMPVVVEAYLPSSEFVIVGAYTLIIVAKLFLLRGSLIVMILSLTGRGISVSFARISVLAKPTPASVLFPRVRHSRRKSIPSRRDCETLRTLFHTGRRCRCCIWQVVLILVPYVFLVGQLILGRGES